MDQALLATEKGVKYNYKELEPCAIGETFVDSLLEIPTKRDREKLRNGQTPEMFCSEFVMFCYNCATDDANFPRYINKPQDKVTREELYVGLRDHSDFTCIGELHKYVR